MTERATFSVGRLSISTQIQGQPREVVSTTAQTRAAVLAAFPDLPVGSLVLSTDRIYVRVAANGAAADFEKVTSSAAD